MYGEVRKGLPEGGEVPEGMQEGGEVPEGLPDGVDGFARWC